jgi:D-glycerate 3-kinase
MRIAALARRRASPAALACYEQLPVGPDDYRQLAALLADDWASTRPRWVGLGGGQGAGKSTLSALIEAACNLRGLRTAVLGLDDFYLTRAERQSLAARVHPLFETRGPPGTHDVAHCGATLHALVEARTCEVPRFDKGRDDRGAPRTLQGPFDLVLLEGWCIGARALDPARLEAPLNELERDADPTGAWRRYFAAQLAGPYARLFAALDALVYLQVPDLDAVRRWRLEQESQRPAAQRMSAEEVDAFVAHYERITLAMLADLPGRADVVVELDAQHAVSGLRFRRDEA